MAVSGPLLRTRPHRVRREDEGRRRGRRQVRGHVLRGVGSGLRDRPHLGRRQLAAARRAQARRRGQGRRSAARPAPGARLLQAWLAGGQRRCAHHRLPSRHPPPGRRRVEPRCAPRAGPSRRRHLAGVAVQRDQPLKHEYRVTGDAAGQRLDKFLRKRLTEVPLSHLYKLVRTKKVRVNGTRAAIAQLLNEGDLVIVHAAQARPEGPAPERPASQVPQDFAILYEDAHLLVCDKPAGLPIHPGTGITGDTLVDQARAYLARQGLEVAEGEFKPSPAHRLDRETSGVVVVAKPRQAMVRLPEIFTAGEAKKTYLALAKGRFQQERGTIDVRLPEHQQTFASKQVRGVNLQEAVTHFTKVG